jgi:hypothetical protein
MAARETYPLSRRTLLTYSFHVHGIFIEAATSKYENKNNTYINTLIILCRNEVGFCYFKSFESGIE